MSPNRDARARAFILLFVLFSALVAVGCQRPQPSPTERLHTALTAFHGHLVFDRFDEAAGFVPSDQRDSFMDYYEDQRGDLHITEFEVTRVEVSPDEHHARAELLVSWYKLPSGTVHTSRMDQTWEFDPDTEHWEVVSQEVRD